MMRRPNDGWSEKEEEYLRRMWGWLPLWKLAEELGRSEVAVVIRVRRKLKLMRIKDWPEVLTESDLAKALGLDRKTVWAMLKTGRLPTMRLWKQNTPVMVVDRSELKAFLSNPDNWYLLDMEKIQDDELRQVVERARRRWDDRWLTIGQAASLIHVEQSTLNKHLNKGSLPGGQRGNWFIKRSDLLRFAREAYGFNG